VGKAEAKRITLTGFLGLQPYIHLDIFSPKAKAAKGMSDGTLLYSDAKSFMIAEKFPYSFSCTSIDFGLWDTPD
jgi:hypothetical protein